MAWPKTGSCSQLTVRTEGKDEASSVGGVGRVERKVLLTAVTEAPLSIDIRVSQSCIEHVIERLSEGNLTFESSALTLRFVGQYSHPSRLTQSELCHTKPEFPRNLESAL